MAAVVFHLILHPFFRHWQITFGKGSMPLCTGTLHLASAEYRSKVLVSAHVNSPLHGLSLIELVQQNRPLVGPVDVRLMRRSISLNCDRYFLTSSHLCPFYTLVQLPITPIVGPMGCRTNNLLPSVQRHNSTELVFVRTMTPNINKAVA